MNSDDLCKNSAIHNSHYYSARQKCLDFLWSVYHGKQYDHLRYPFSQETRSGTEEYIPLRERKPSVRYKLPKIVVKKSVGMCFAGRNWPTISTDNQKFSDWLDAFYKKFNFSPFATRVATFGSIGSVVPVFKLNKSTKVLTLDVWNAKDCSPIFDPSGDLEEVTLRYLTTTDSLRTRGISPGLGFSKEPRDKKWWFRRKLTKQEDIVYSPTEENEWDESDPEVAKKIQRLDEFSSLHNLGFVPALWVRNLPVEDDSSDAIDGMSTFGDIIDIVIEIDYTLSQTGRGLKYNSDPDLMVKEPMGNVDGTATHIKTVRTLEVGEKGDAKLLEMQGTGQKVCLEYVEKLRNFALEVLRGSRKDPQRALSHAMSGKMAELLEDDLIGLATELRTCYGTGFLIPFTKKILAALEQYELVGGTVIEEIDEDTINSIDLSWGPWFEPSSSDHLQFQQALDLATEGGRLDIETARQQTYHYFGKIVPKTLDLRPTLAVLRDYGIAINAWQILMGQISAAQSAQSAQSASAQKTAGSEGGAEGGGNGKDKPSKPKMKPPKMPSLLEDMGDLGGFAGGELVRNTGGGGGGGGGEGGEGEHEIVDLGDVYDISDVRKGKG
jgi:hypothetical protein